MKFKYHLKYFILYTYLEIDNYYQQDTFEQHQADEFVKPNMPLQ